MRTIPLLFALTILCTTTAHADIRKLKVHDAQVNAPPAGQWIDLIHTTESGRFVDADFVVSGAGTCGEWRVLVDGQLAYRFDHHYQYPRQALPGAPVQQMQRFDAGYLIEVARVAPPEPIHFSKLTLQFRAMPGCASPGYIHARTTNDLF
jgi:hypothetical protein